MSSAWILQSPARPRRSHSPSSILQLVLGVPIAHPPASSTSSNPPFPIDHVLGVLKFAILQPPARPQILILHRPCPRRPRRPHSPSTMSSASSNPQFHVLGVLKFPILQSPARPWRSHYPSTMSSAWILHTPARPQRSYSPSSSLQRALKSSISHRPCPRRPQIPHPPASTSSSASSFPIDHVLGVDSPCSSASSAFLFPILQPASKTWWKRWKGAIEILRMTGDYLGRNQNPRMTGDYRGRNQNS